MSALGQNFAVFRGEESNQIHVLDAYCSHLGADLTAGGNFASKLSAHFTVAIAIFLQFYRPSDWRQNPMSFPSLAM